MIKRFIPLLLALPLGLQAQTPLTAKQSDPKVMGWMQGFPPAKERTVSAIDGSFFRFPALRYSVCHMRTFMPTTVVPASQERRYTFKAKLDKGIDSVTFLPLGSQTPMTWQEALDANYTDGVIILHKGRIVYERYFGELSPNGLHAAMSVSKTFTGTLGALLIAEGTIDANKTVAEYVPELAQSAFGNATVRQVLDMTTGILYREDYSDPNAEIWAFSAAGNHFAPLPTPTSPASYYEYMPTVKPEGKHGEAFGYKTINTDVMGWIISRATGKRIPDLLSERIWSRLGTHFDGYYQVDRSGIAFAGGGFNANLRDMAMFGEMIRQGGRFNGRQILPSSVVKDIMKGGSREAFARSSHGKLYPGWSYRNMWWVLHNEHGAFTARGVHGQVIYVDPKAEMVIVRFASHPQATNAANDPTSLPAYHAVAKYLLNKKR